MISTMTMVCMGISALLSIGVPVVLLFWFHRKYGGSFVPALVGALAFVVFAMVLEAQVHQLVLKPDAQGNIAMRTEHPFMFMLYGAFMAGIFEETARFVSFQAMKHRYRGIGNALTYGVGHGGIEAILLAGVTMVMYVVYALQINAGAALPDALVQTLTLNPPYAFLISGIERMTALAIQISLSVVVYYSVVTPGKMWLFPLAIVLHALVDCPAALMQACVLTSIALVEILIAVVAALYVWLAVCVHRKYKAV